jgi:phage terminase small subunit
VILRRKLSLRRRKYVEGRARGKTKTQAALEAGYAKSVARNAKDRIETVDVHEAFARLIREGVPAEKLVQLLREGLDATETKFVAFRGRVRDVRRVVDFSKRRAYLELVVEYGGYHQKEKPVESSRGPRHTSFHTVIEHIGSQRELSPRGVILDQQSTGDL